MYPPSQGNRIFRGAVVKPLNFRDNHPADKNLVSVNVQQAPKYETKADREPLLAELQEPETLPEETADILNQASSMVAFGEDDLPLGTDANTLSGIPSGSALSSHGSEIIDEKPQPPLLPPKSSPSHTCPNLSGGSTHPWLQALSGRQQSFGSDLSTGTNSSVNSIEILLQGREADPEEILMSLGFGSTEDNNALTSRIPSRFLMLNSEARGVSIDDLFGQRSELQELIDNWNCQKYTSGNWNHTPRLPPYLHGIRFLSSIRAAACRSSPDKMDSIPNSILTPDNQLALAKQGYYDSFPSPEKEQSSATLSTTSPTASKPLSASEKRQKFKSTRSSRPWSLIEPETNIDSYSTDFRPSTSTLATSIDSSMSSDNVDRSWTGRQRSVSELRWSYLNCKSRDSLSSTSSISQARQIQVSKLMNNEDDDGDYQVQPLSFQMSEKFDAAENVFLEDEPKENALLDCPDSHNADISSIAMQTSPEGSSWKSRSTGFGGDCLSSLVKQSTPEKCTNVNSGYLADGECSYLEPEVPRRDQDLYKDAMLSSIDLEDPNANHVPRNSRDLWINSRTSLIPEGISSYCEQEGEQILKTSASQEKSPVICRYESAQSDSSGFAEPETDVVVVSVPFSNLDSLSVHKGSCDSFDTISSGRLQRLSINSDTTIKEISDQSPCTFDADLTQISVCDKSTITDHPVLVDQETLTLPIEVSHKAIQTDAHGRCQCSSGPRYKPPMLGQLSKSAAIETQSTLLNYPPATDDPLPDIRNLTSFDSGFSPSKHEVSVLNLYVYDGRIWFCDNDSTQSSKWSISGGHSTSSVHMYDQVCHEPSDSTDYGRSTRYGEFGEFPLKPISTMNSKSFSKRKLTTGHISLDSHEDDRPRKPSARLNNKEQIREYKKLLKLTNQRYSIQCFMKNTFPLYSPRFQIDIWCERHIDEHLQEENQLMQYAVQRYKSDLQVMESAFLSEFNRTGGLLSEEDTLLMDELYELWTDISLEVVHLERQLADRQRLIRKGECELTTLTTLDVIQTMVEVLKEQLYLFHMNNDIVESSTQNHEPSPSPICRHPGWKDISNEVHELRHQITGNDTLQAIHLKKAVEEFKDTILSEIRQEITDNLNKLSAR